MIYGVKGTVELLWPHREASAHGSLQIPRRGREFQEATGVTPKTSKHQHPQDRHSLEEWILLLKVSRSNLDLILYSRAGPD